MFGHSYFAARFFAPRYWTPAVRVARGGWSREQLARRKKRRREYDEEEEELAIIYALLMTGHIRH